MPTLTILRGISGSGKSSWARNQNAVVISRDNIRHGLLDVSPEDWYSGARSATLDENVVSQIQDAAIAACLKAGKDVIVDNTNIQFKFVRQLAKIGYRNGAEVEVKVFDVDLETALNRNGLRSASGGRFVAPDIIRKQHESFKNNKSMTLDRVENPQPYNGTPGKPKAFLVDIDGTLAHMRGKRGPFDWQKVHLDEPDEKIIDIVNVLGSSNFALDLGHYKVIVMSGRDASCRDLTEEWLSDYIQFDHLFMRPEKDMRPDNLIKAELFDEHVRDNFDVQFVIDDRWAVCEMWLRMGLKVLNVSGLDRGEF